MLPVYAPVKSVLVEVSTWGLLLAIGALGLGTSVKTIIGLGWRHVTTVLGATAVIFVRGDRRPVADASGVKHEPHTALIPASAGRDLRGVIHHG